MLAHNFGLKSGKNCPSILMTALSLGAAVSDASSNFPFAHQEVISGELFLTIHWLKAKAHFYY